MNDNRNLGLRAGIAVGLVAYLVIGMAQIGPGDGERDHFFPFIPWNMFAYAREHGPYFVMVTMDGGRRYDPPKELGEAVGKDEQRRIDAVAMGNTLAESVANGDKPRAEAARRAIESKLLKAPWAYEVYEGRNSLKSWSSGGGSDGGRDDRRD